MSWDFDPKRPIYLQIAEKLRGDIFSAVYPLSSKFPTVRDLAVQASVNPNTMLKALQLLEAEGFLITHRTTGRVVTDDLSKLQQKKEGKTHEIVEKFAQDMKQLGYTKEEIIQIVKELTL